MKKLFTVLAVILFTASMWAESPQKMSYQAVVRNTKGALVVNQTVGVQISIYYYTTKVLTKNVYVETQTPTTNVNGLISIEIGTGTVVEGVFADIDWAGKFFYIKTEIDPGGRTSYSITSDTQILSVPYALHAKTASNIADNSVNSTKITDGSIITADIANNAVTIAKLPAGATSNTFLRGDGTWNLPASGGTSPVISYLSVGAYSFFPAVSVEYETFNGFRNIINVNEDWKYTLEAPLTLPSGAKITKVTFYYIDNGPDDMDLSLKKSEITGTSSTTSTIISGTTTGINTSKRSMPLTTNHIVDNSKYEYRINIISKWKSKYPNALYMINGVIVEYEIITE
ncbi:MAG TPA: hypothetical protein P5084_05590 [Paludibacter sp.]|nr:hypothetical protein [Paludibacter sp.]